MAGPCVNVLLTRIVNPSPANWGRQRIGSSPCCIIWRRSSQWSWWVSPYPTLRAKSAKQSLMSLIEICCNALCVCVWACMSYHIIRYWMVLVCMIFIFHKCISESVSESEELACRNHILMQLPVGGGIAVFGSAGIDVFGSVFLTLVCVPWRSFCSQWLRQAIMIVW